MSKPLTQEQRDAMPDHEFAVPGKRKLPTPDVRHTKMAWSQLPRTEGLTPEEKKHAKEHILRRAHELGIDTDEWTVHASVDLTFTLSAMSLDMPDDAHPNRMPFKGILTRVDEPSDKPPGGSDGKRVYIPASVAEEALSSLLGMGVDCTPNFDGHDARFKIGVITEATVEGNAVHIAGHLFRGDFPSECSAIKQKKSALGFSYECKCWISDKDADPWIVDRIVFTGAAILYRDKAAYETTSIAANAQTEADITTAQADKDQDMTPEQLKELNDSIAKLAASVGAIGTQVTAQADKLAKLQAAAPFKGVSLAGPIIDTVRPHVEACHACADAMEAAGIGTHPTQGHAAKLRDVGNHLMMAAATNGRVPHIYNDHSYFGRDGMEASAANAGSSQKAIDEAVAKVKAESEAALKAAADANAVQAAALKEVTDKLGVLGTQLADLQAKGAAGTTATVTQPTQKTLQAGQDFANKFGAELDANGQISVDQFDKVLDKKGIFGKNAIAAKLRGRQVGILQ